MRSTTIHLTDYSGAYYAFEVFPLDGALPPLPVVYFVYEQVTGSGMESRHPVYVGQARDASSCMDDHHRQCYVANGATHIALHVDYDEAVRGQKVVDLVQALSPICNV